MIKIKETKPEFITLVKGNKKIKRTYLDYQANKNVWNFRGYKVEEIIVKDEKVVELKPKKKTKKKKDVQPDLENN
jgi:hypothetical protein